MWKLLIIIKVTIMPNTSRLPIHPGEFLQDELNEIGMTAAELAIRLHVPKNRIYQIISYQRNITADTALRLGKFFGVSPQLWLNLQKDYELDMATKKLQQTLKKIKPYPHRT